MKLIQLNAWGGRLTHTLNDFLRAENPDILCLQEAIDLDHGRGALFTSVDEMREILGANYLYMSPVFSFHYMHRTAHFGNCIISRLPILEKETLFTGKDYAADFDWTKHTQNIRNLQHVQLRLTSGGVVHIFNHHGHHVHEHKNGGEESIRQCRIIAEKIKMVTGKVILTGDFNLSPRSQSLKPLNTLLRNLAIEAGLKTTRNSLTNKTEVCDYIFTSNNVEVVSFSVSDTLVSDHQALVIDFQ